MAPKVVLWPLHACHGMHKHTNDDDDDDNEKESGESSSEGSTEVVSANEKYRVYIDAPEDVEAYLDGSYIGMTPVSFP